MTISISIIVPIYNKEFYLESLLMQISKQKFREFECILVDDGSTDRSGKICDDFVEKDFRFRVFHITNGGVSRARNIALNNACGKYITFIDADDEIDLDYLNNLYQCLQYSNADVVVGSLKKVWDLKEKQQIIGYPKSNCFLTKKEILQDFAKIQEQTGIFGYCTCKLFEKEKINDIRFDESLNLAEDFDFYLKLYAQVESFYFDDKPYYYYRQEAENSTAIMADDEIDYFSQIKINLRYRDFMKKENAYINENKKIIDEKINNYIFFMMFYCKKEYMIETFKLLYKLCKKENIYLTGKNIRQKILLKLLNFQMFSVARNVILLYRKLRDLKHEKSN